jgi:3-oxoacyl-[acyl-carrier protein] reductase
VSTALITGASHGIGRAIAQQLADGWNIVAVARSQSELEALAHDISARGGRCRALALDITDHAAVSRALSSLDVDVLVNNAGIGIIKPVAEMSVEEWRTQVALNLDAMFYVTRALLPGMLARKRGHIVNIGSLTGRNPIVGGACYSGTKHAVVGFTESLMLEVRDAGVRVSLIMPGSVDTGFAGHGKGAPWKLTPETVGRAVRYVLEQTDEALISRVELRPARVESSK